MSRYLEKHLFPKGRSESEPDLMPNVLDSDSAPVTFISDKRKTNESTVVNLGSSPNSNDGDPLRTAFAKINNFIEASYWTNESLNAEVEGMILGIAENKQNIEIFGGGLDSDVGVIKNVTLPAIRADLDSDSAILQSLQSQVNLLNTNADSDVIAIAQLRRDADSDSLEIQRISLSVHEAQADIDSDVAAFNAKLSSAGTGVDSDVTVLQNLISALQSDHDSDNLVLLNRITLLESTTDSDSLIFDSEINIIQTVLDGGGY